MLKIFAIMQASVHRTRSEAFRGNKKFRFHLVSDSDLRLDGVLRNDPYYIVFARKGKVSWAK